VYSIPFAWAKVEAGQAHYQWPIDLGGDLSPLGNHGEVTRLSASDDPGTDRWDSGNRECGGP
jgi:hypothetical protein